MAVTVKEFSAPSSDGVHELRGVVFCPEGERKGFFGIVHGMTEHIARYERIMRDMAEEGFVCFGYDQLGHGKTAKGADELGFIAKTGGWDLLAQDVRRFSDAVIAAYGEGEKLPCFLMGHSMGSFIARLSAEKYISPDGLLVMGTGGSNPAAGLGLAVVALVKLLCGEKHHSALVDRLAFGSYNKRFGGKNTEDPKGWLTTDASVRKKYYADPFCTFPFTVSAMGDLIRLTKYSNRAAWYKKIAGKMPILLLSGENDPVGGYGKGVKSVYRKLLRHGADAECLLYPDARHEILNDFTYETVKKDILDFCNKTVRASR